MRDSTTSSTRSTGRATSHPTPDLFDADADDLTTEFWGTGSGWVSRDAGHQRASRAFQIRSDERSSPFRLDDTPTSLQAIKDGIAAFRPARRRRVDVTGPIERTREHGIVRPNSLPPEPETSPAVRAPARRGRPSVAELPHRDATIAELATGAFEPVAPGAERGVDLESTLMIPVSGDAPADRLGLSVADPARVRLGVAVLALVLAIPLALALRSTNDRDVQTETPPAVEDPAVDAPGDAAPDVGGPAGEAGSVAATEAATAEVADVPGPTTAAPTLATEAGAAEPTVATASTASSAAATPAAEPTEGGSQGAVAAGSLTEAAPVANAVTAEGAVDQPATVDEPAERAVPDCSLTYTAAPGDSWYRMADAAGVRPAELLAQNTATIDTIVFPGDTICLPQGATVPSPPTTVAPTTTVDSSSSDAPTTTAAPTTIAAPTTTIAPIPTSSISEVQALIREIWPDDLEERALEIAYRESGYVATADNGWCCVGVFQLYWTVHRSWLDDYGIHTRDQLKDARKNITAAHALYQRAGGWGPWSTA